MIIPQHLQDDLVIWIEGCCNRERRPSTIGFLSSTCYEQQVIAARTLTLLHL
jgi:hypothetical protein